MDDAENEAAGHVPDGSNTPKSSKKRRLGEEVELRAEACNEYAENPDKFRSLTLFVSDRKTHTEKSGWIPSKTQVSRDMQRIFGAEWAFCRGGGGRGRCGRKGNAHVAPGLLTTPDAYLKPIEDMVFAEIAS